MVIPTEAATSRATLQRAHDLVQADPGAAQDLVLQVLRDSGRRRDPATTAMAQRVLGLVASHLHDHEAAEQLLRASVRTAQRAGESELEARARMSLGLVLVHRGRSLAALHQVDRATPHLHGLDAGHLALQRALLMQYLGRQQEALDGYREALPALRRGHDDVALSRLLGNRGVLHAYRGSLDAAQADVAAALELCERTGQHLTAAGMVANLGFIAARRGDVPAALEHYSKAEQMYAEHGVSSANVLLDRAELLLSVRLVEEARVAAQAAADGFEKAGSAILAAEARLLQSQAALFAGDSAAALSAGRAAREQFLRQHRPGYAALAAFAVLSARVAAGEAVSVGEAARTAALLAEQGWAVPAADARLVAARVALSAGRPRVAAPLLRDTARLRRTGPVALRARAWHAQALLHDAEGHPRAARAALRQGLAAVHAVAGTLGATELRAHVSGHGAALASAGLSAALAEGAGSRAAANVLTWAEWGRAGALRHRPVRPEADAELAQLLVSLRAAASSAEGEAASGRSASVLLARQAAAERAVRDHVRAGAALSPGRGGLPATDLLGLRRDLGDRTLIEYVLAGQRLLAVVVTADRPPRLVDLGAVELGHDLAYLTAALRRLARAPSVPSARPAERSMQHSAAALQQAVLEPLLPLVGSAPLVIVPAGRLQGLPWSVLPALAGREVSVAPSAALWRQAASAERAGPGPVTVASGPGLPGAHQEAVDVAGLYPGSAALLTGDAATCEQVLDAAAGSTVLHLAAHGSFRADNPLFSYVQLADGPLTVYDVERLPAVPQTVLLSSCDGARHAVLPGEELLGMAAALLGRGTTALVAAAVSVPDASTGRLMIRVHKHLAAGSSPASALALAQQAADGPAETAAAASFTCYGAG